MKKILAVLILILFLISSLNVSGNESSNSENDNCNICSSSSNNILTPEDIEELIRIGEQEGWSFSVGENSVTNIPLDKLCGLVEPDNLNDELTQGDISLSDVGLPTNFDWRDLGGVTPIKHQGSCGSCWAFSTVAPLECNIKIKDEVTVDLSEQWLVSCTSAGSCHGGWFAHSYHSGSKKDYCNDYGAVFEEDFPYVASDTPCGCPYDHYYTINTWGYAGGNNPSVEAIKNAIYNYGPVSCAVRVNSAFQAYNGGIFDTSSSGNINHAVALVGWNEDEDYWILRNSWGTGWGEDGYMRIKYGCQGIGYKTGYVVYTGGGSPELDIEITSPQKNQAVSGLVNIQGIVNSNQPGEELKVEISIDDSSWNLADGVFNWNYEWDTLNFTNDYHEIKARLLFKSIEKEVTIGVLLDNVNNPPVAVAGGPYLGFLGEEIQFDGSGSYDIDNDIESYHWNFGDGTTGSGVSPIHIYTEIPHQTIAARLTVFDINGSTNSNSVFVGIRRPENFLPTISDEYPSNNEMDIAINLDSLGIDIEDREGDLFDWMIETSPNIGSNNAQGAVNGTKTCSISNLAYDTTYTWFVNVTTFIQNIQSIRKEFSFHTETHSNSNSDPDKPINPDPIDESANIDLKPTLRVDVYDSDFDILNASFYLNDFLIGVHENIIDSNNANFEIFNDLDYDTRYEWYVIVDDGLTSNRSDTWSFTTISEPNPPVKNMTISFKENICIGKISAEIENVGEVDLSDIEWSISVKGGFLKGIDLEVSGLISELNIEEKVIISSVSEEISGFGFVNVVAEIKENGDTISAGMKGLVIGMMIILF